jgi:hypothetical protein
MRIRVAALLLLALTLAACGSSKKSSAPGEGTRQRTASSTTPVAPAATSVSGAQAAGKKLTETESNAVQQSLCSSEQLPGIAANFGFRRTRAEAEVLTEHARRSGFQNLQVQQRSCNQFAAVLPGLANLRQAQALRTEARTVGLHVRIECRSHPVEGGLAAVFGHRPTHRGAILLKRRAQNVGFQNLQVQQDRCNDWEVDLYGISTPGQRHELRREAAKVGFHLTFEAG